MNSVRPGSNILAVEVTNVSKNGFWLFIGEEERFVPFDHFPGERGTVFAMPLPRRGSG
jgi:hypothetical protein